MRNRAIATGDNCNSDSYHRINCQITYVTYVFTVKLNRKKFASLEHRQYTHMVTMDTQLCEFNHVTMSIVFITNPLFPGIKFSLASLLPICSSLRINY